MIKKVKEKVLNNSDSYKFYKKEYESSNKKINKLDKKYDKEYKKLKKQIKNQNLILNSYNSLFNTLFIDYKLKPKGGLKYTQELSQLLLDFIDNICKKYDLEYWLDYGTLLGCVRHQNYIPWDDDIDISMIRKDFEKLLEVLETELKSYELEDMIIINIDEFYPKHVRSFLKLDIFTKDKGKVLAGVDIFPYDYVENADETTRGTFSDCFKRYRQKMNNNEDKEVALQEYYEKLGVSKEKKDYIIPGLDGTWGEYTQFRILKTDEMFPFIKVNFEGMECPAPNNWRYYLETRYGPDYMSVPKKVFNHNRTDYLRKMDNINQKYETALEKLKEINKIYE